MTASVPSMALGTPLTPRTTCCASGPSGSIVMMTSLRAATSLELFPFAAPVATSSRTASG